MELNEDKYKISIAGKWYLEDLYVFPRAYEQVYFLIYSLLPHDDEMIQDRIQYAYSQFPWRGGYSAVNFYNNLKYTTPRKERPQILSMQYASPGWIELSLIIGVAVAVERLVKAISSTIRKANATYNEVYRGLQERKLLRIKVEKNELELEMIHAAYIEHSAQKMANMLQLNELDQMHSKTGSSLKTLKILLSLYRRVRTLVDYKRRGKIEL
jgi:hypothetical protein